MDSHLIAGAYSQGYTSLKADDILANSERLDAIARAKKLSQETNRRRKLQANKRKLHTKREEKRRHDILTRRREEQRQATEKYQRSHLPPSARQSYRFVQYRPSTGVALDDAMQLIRGVPNYHRYMSSLERVLSETNENKDPLEAALYKPRPHSTYGGPIRVNHQMDSKKTAELMNYSKQNLTNSKSLFEQILEQQQNNLLDQQQKSMQEFTSALNSEIGRKEAVENTAIDRYNDNDAQNSEGDITHSNSCSSLDSLEGSLTSDPEYVRLSNPRLALTQLKQRPVSAYTVPGSGLDINQNQSILAQPQQDIQLQQQRLKNISLLNNQQVLSYQQNQNVQSFASNRNNDSLTEITKAATILKPENIGYPYTNKQKDNSFNNFTGISNIQQNKEILVNGKLIEEKKHEIKQMSADSLGSSSTNNGVLVHKFQADAKEFTIVDCNLKSEKTGNNDIIHLSSPDGNISFPIKNVGNGSQLHSNNLNLTQKVFVSMPNNSTNVTIQPALKSIPTSEAGTTTFAKICQIENKQNVEIIQPKYTSAIVTTVLSGGNVQNQTPFLNNASSSSPAAQSILPENPISNAVANAKANISVAAESRLDHTRSATKIDDKKNMNNFIKFSSTNCDTNAYQDIGNIHKNAFLKQIQDSSATQINNHLQQTDVQPDIPEHLVTAGIQPTNKQAPIQNSAIQNISLGESYMTTFTMQQHQSSEVYSNLHQDSQYYNKQLLNNNVIDNNTITPTITRNLPTSRPPSPVAYAIAKVIYPNKSVGQTTTQVNMNVVGENEAHPTTYDQAPLYRDRKIDAKEYVVDDLLVDEDCEEIRPLRGILKQVSFKMEPEDNSAGNKVYFRDSVELAHVQKDKKNNKKKSVRFANDDHNEEDDNDSDTAEFDEKWISSASTSYKNTSNRPLSAKFASSTKTESSTRVQRAFSAGPFRQQPLTSENIEIKNAQQIVNNSTPASIVENNNATYSKIYGQRSNLPPSFAVPLNTSPISRPKAAAHIIMSTDVHKEASVVYNTPLTGPSTTHISQLETKVRAVNNNFMSKVPVKIPTSKDSSVMVHNVSYAPFNANANVNGNISGINNTEDLVNHSKKWQQQQNLDRYRNAILSSKTTPSSNSEVTQTGPAPIPLKTSSMLSQVGPPSFPTTAGNAVYNETGMRIDRTPTDEEITWLWDKVRNCLNKENGNKYHNFANGDHSFRSNVDKGPRQHPTLSTKLIDGDALALGMHKNDETGGVSSVRPGVFNPHSIPITNTPNIINPAIQQQGGYLRRYGLLKQRRASSASAVRNNSGLDSQKAGGVNYCRQPTIQQNQTSNAANQQPKRDIPTPMAFSYKPQDEVSESTAAFLMAERLTKKSLSDSHIHMAMDDAHCKQEAYNRSLLLAGSRNGHSALSLEEHRLLESLDKLNDRLKEPKFNGIIPPHQHSQAQLPAFPGQKLTMDIKRNIPMTSANQQRAQSARVRQNIYQYR